MAIRQAAHAVKQANVVLTVAAGFERCRALGVEKFEVDVFCSFASALSCSYAFACCGVCVDA